jgi:uncharacterized phage protein (TIGR01671 family)
MLEQFFKHTAQINTMYDMSYELFTGLKDKNQVNVYENDIVKAEGWNPENYIIKFIKGGFCLTSDDRILTIDINMVYDSLGCHIAVIGNIYEGS